MIGYISFVYLILNVLNQIYKVIEVVMKITMFEDIIMPFITSGRSCSSNIKWTIHTAAVLHFVFTLRI